MYRYCCRRVPHVSVCRSPILSSVAYCSSQGNPPPASEKSAVSAPPTDGSRLATADAAMTFMRADAPTAAAVGRRRGEAVDDVENDDNDDDYDNDDSNVCAASPRGGRDAELENEQSGLAGASHNDDGALPRSIAERQSAARCIPAAELVEMTVLYLRATVNPRLVSADEEHVVFPVLMERLQELRVEQMLDVVGCHWARSTLVRYGTAFKDMVRDRIAVIASVAAKGATQTPKRKSRAQRSGGMSAGDNISVDNNNNNNNDTNDALLNAFHEEEEVIGNDGNDDNDNDDVGVYIDEVNTSSTDPILLNAKEEMNADSVLRCIIVMGMSAGRRKRDLHFFQAMGVFLVHHVNHYKDPHELVRVLTAFSRAKIVPPKGFLALLGRRFAVLNKKKPLGALPSYRALVNLYKMGHDQMNSFRFLANCIYETIDANVKSEKKRKRLMELQRMKETSKEKEENTSTTTTTTTNNNNNNNNNNNTIMAAPVGDLDPQLPHVIKARERFKRLTELKPSMFTKLLLVLARFGAPHQQYLRPTIAPLILPTLHCFPPPSFSRLLRAVYLFRSTDLELIEPLIDYLADDLTAKRVLFEDVLEMIRIVSPADVPVPRNLSKLLLLSEAVYSGADETTMRPILPNDMCSVAASLMRIQMKDEVPLDALDPLTRLMEVFAERLTSLLQLHVVSLTHVDVFADLCKQQHHPDVSGKIASLVHARRRISAEEGDDEYYSRLDIDVRETFHRIMMVNDYKTYGQYRPTPGILQVDFKQALTEVSAFDVLEATDLFARAFPNTLQPTVVRHLSRSIIAKLGDGGEEVITENNTIVVRPPRDLLLTKEDLLKFVELVKATPLKRVRESSVVWGFIMKKAQRLKMSDALKISEIQTAAATV